MGDIIDDLDAGIDILNRIGEEDTITNELLEEGVASLRAIGNSLHYELEQLADENNATKQRFLEEIRLKTYELRNRWKLLQKYYRAPLRNSLRAKLEELANAWADLQYVLPHALKQHEPNVEGGPPLGGGKKRKVRKSRKASKKSRKTRRR